MLILIIKIHKISLLNYADCQNPDLLVKVSIMNF